MSRNAEKFISKVMQESDPQAFIRYGLEERHFTSESAAKAYRFISRYAKENRNKVPDYTTLAEETELYVEDSVDDTYEFLAKNIKEEYADFESYKILTQKAKHWYKELNGIEFAEKLIEEFGNVLTAANVRAEVGSDIKAKADEYLEEYRRRKEGDSIKVWLSSFPTVNRVVGPYRSGNMYTWYGRSGRGKSVFTLKEAVWAAWQGATVLVWSMEMPRYDVMSRAYAMISALHKLQTVEHEGKRIKGGFDNQALSNGSLEERAEMSFEEFIRDINENLAGTIIFRCVDDDDFHSRRVKDLEADILATDADVVVIDPFYYMHYERNMDNKTSGAAELTSQKLRALAGRYKIVLHVITQADEVKDEESGGVRLLRPPKRSEVKKTKAVLEDASMLIGIDSIASDGEGIMSLGKGREGGEGTEIDVLYLPKYGIVEEMPTGEAVGGQFSGDF